MENYANLSGNSGVIAYEIGYSYIRVQFKTGKDYTYSYERAGSDNVETMKALARSGRGLCSFIQKYVRDAYDR